MNEPKVYVSTYAKYNAGSLEGEWVDLDLFTDKEEFLEYCGELHKDEPDPEFMYQDWENVPDSLRDVNDVLFEWLDADDRDNFGIYLENYGGDYDDFQDRFQGNYDSEEAFAEEIMEQQDVPQWLESYIDYGKYARELFSDGYRFYDGAVFYNN